MPVESPLGQAKIVPPLSHPQMPPGSKGPSRLRTAVGNSHLLSQMSAKVEGKKHGIGDRQSRKVIRLTSTIY